MSEQIPPSRGTTQGELIRMHQEAEDSVNHPRHYTSHPSGVECIAITEHMSFCVGNAVKYLWRADLKHADALEDLKKARWYIDREIARRERCDTPAKPAVPVCLKPSAP